MTIEVTTALPFCEGIADSEWTLSEPVGAFEPDADFGPGQVVRYTTARWLARLRFEGLSPADRHQLGRFAAAVGRHRSFWMYDPSHSSRGSFAPSELLVAANMTAGTDRVVTQDTDAVRVTKTGATAVSYAASAAMSVTANAYYAWRGIVEYGLNASNAVTPNAGSTPGGTNYGAGAASSTGGRFALRAAPTGATMYVNVYDNLAESANWTQQGFWLLRRPTVARALVVDGGSGALTQSGTSLYVKGFDASAVAGVLRLGDMVEVVSGTHSQMVRLLEDANADASGKSWIRFEPYLRKPMSNLDLVIPYRPWVRMRLTTDPALLTRPGWYGSIELECRESFV